MVLYAGEYKEFYTSRETGKKGVKTFFVTMSLHKEMTIFLLSRSNYYLLQLYRSLSLCVPLTTPDT